MDRPTSTPNFESRNPNFRAFVERYVSAQNYLGLIGVVLARVEAGLVEYRVPYRADLGQQDGFFHGGVVGGLAEAVMGAAAATLVPPRHNVVGAEYKVNLLSPASGQALLARRGCETWPDADRLPCRGVQRGRQWRRSTVRHCPRCDGRG